MGKYSYLITQMTWSYSRLRCFEQCPYRFLMSYIYPADEEPQFYAEYGLFVHRLLADFFSGKIKPEALITKYITGFYQEIKPPAPSPEIGQKFFGQGLQYMQNLQHKDASYEVVGVEQEISFHLYGYRFKGFIDLLLRDQEGRLIIVDHKSHPLKQRSGRKKPTKSDQELDEYLRQLYLYSLWAIQEMNEEPAKLVFNCYRTGEVIEEVFDSRKMDEAMIWARDLIRRIEAEEDYNPMLEYFPCKYICPVHDECEYYELGGRHGSM